MQLECRAASVAAKVCQDVDTDFVQVEDARLQRGETFAADVLAQRDIPLEQLLTEQKLFDIVFR